jgi:hypothetical protein
MPVVDRFEVVSRIIGLFELSDESCWEMVTCLLGLLYALSMTSSASRDTLRRHHGVGMDNVERVAGK